MRVILREQAENKLVTLERVGLLAFASPVVICGVYFLALSTRRGCFSPPSAAIAPSPLAPSGEGVPSLDLSFNNFDVYLVLMKLINLNGVKFVQPSSPHSPHQRNTTVLVAKLFLTSAKPKPVLWYTVRVIYHPQVCVTTIQY